MSDWKMRAADFYELLRLQDYRCKITSQHLAPETVAFAHLVPLRFGGKHELSNIQLVHETVAGLARSLKSEQIIALAMSIVMTNAGVPAAEHEQQIDKADWKIVTRRITTLNQSATATYRPSTKQPDTWGKAFEKCLHDLRYRLQADLPKPSSMA